MAHEAVKATSIANRKKLRLVAEAAKLQRCAQVDNTERKHAESVAERLCGAVYSTSESFALGNAEARLVYSNKRYHEFFPTISHFRQPGALRKKLRRAYDASGAAVGCMGARERISAVISRST